MQGWGVGWWKSSRVIGASSSCRCGLTLTPTLSRKERAIWILLLPVQFGAIGHFAGFGYPGLSSVALAVDKPQRYISRIRFSAVVATRMAVGVAGRCRNPSRIGVRDMLSIAGMTNWGAGMTKRGPVAFRHTLRPRNTIFVPMTNSVRGASYFPTNRSCRQAPAHEGMKNRSCDLVWRVGAVGSATPLVDPCGGQAPALQDSGICRNDEARRGSRDSRARWDASIPDRSPGHAFVPMLRMIHSLLIETVGESVWAKLLGTTSHGSCFAWARIETLQYRRLEAGRRG